MRAAHIVVALVVASSSICWAAGKPVVRHAASPTWIAKNVASMRGAAGAVKPGLRSEPKLMQVAPLPAAVKAIIAKSQNLRSGTVPAAVRRLDVDHLSSNELGHLGFFNPVYVGYGSGPGHFAEFDKETGPASPGTVGQSYLLFRWWPKSSGTFLIDFTVARAKKIYIKCWNNNQVATFENADHPCLVYETQQINEIVFQVTGEGQVSVPWWQFHAVEVTKLK